MEQGVDKKQDASANKRSFDYRLKLITFINKRPLRSEAFIVMGIFWLIGFTFGLTKTATFASFLLTIYYLYLYVKSNRRSLRIRFYKFKKQCAAENRKNRQRHEEWRKSQCGLNAASSGGANNSSGSSISSSRYNDSYTSVNPSTGMSITSCGGMDAYGNCTGSSSMGGGYSGIGSY